MSDESSILSYSELYTQYKDKVFAYICARVDNVQTAEDLLSAVFLKVGENCHSYDSGKASPSTWIYTITHNTVVDYFRVEARRASIVSLELLDTEPAIEIDFVARLVQEENLNKLADTLEALPEIERDLILLFYYHELPLKEVAVSLGLSYSGAKYHHKAALERIKKILN